jgi:hypothetical protein
MATPSLQVTPHRTENPGTGALTLVERLFDSDSMSAEVTQAARMARAAQMAQVTEPSPGRRRGDIRSGDVVRGDAVRPGDAVRLGDAVLPVLPALRTLLPGGGLHRGSVVATGGWSLLCLALVAGASAAGAWCAVIGLPYLGMVAAADAGLDPDRVLLIANPGPGWPQVVASLLDGCELVLLCPPDRPSASVRRRLEATVRRLGGVLVVAGDWDGAQTRLLVADQEWAGIGAGHGRLRARRVQVMADGRGAAARLRARWLWLPGPDGSVTVADEIGAARFRPGTRSTG